MTWSLSSLGTFEKCQLKYKFKYVDKIKDQRSTSANRGVDLHKVVEDFVTGTTDVLPPNLSFYHQFLTGLKEHEIYPEHKISLTKDWQPTTWEDGWYHGVLDLKLIAPGGTEAVVYDWKTGKIYPDHVDQRSLYSLAVSSEHPTVQRVRAVHVYLDLGQNRETTYDKTEMHGLREHWESRLKFLEMTKPEEMIPNPGYHCRWCSFSKMQGGPCRF